MTRNTLFTPVLAFALLGVLLQSLAQQPPAHAMRVILTPPGAPLMVASQPATVPISVFGASRISTVTLSLRFDPKVLRVRLVQEGTFLSAGGGTVTFAQQVDAASGRVDITLTDSFRQSMLISQGDLSVFFANPLVGGITTLAVAMLLWPAAVKLVERVQPG